MTTELPDISRGWPGRIHSLTIGGTRDQGGTRERTVTIGGGTTLPFHHFDGAMRHRPAVALEITDTTPYDWPEALRAPVADVMHAPAAWAEHCTRPIAGISGPDLLCLRLDGCNPNGADRSPEQTAVVARAVRDAVDLPLVIWGCGDVEKDAEVFPAVAEALAGERCLLGTITDRNYRTLTALATAFGHSVIAESPVDINMAKQINILAIDAGFPEERLVIYPTTGALGYGIEYVYSIIERLRIGALKGDRLVSMPIVADIGREVWSVKEARATLTEEPAWGDENRRGPAWETATALTYLHAGADLVILRHPEAVAATKRAIDRLMIGAAAG